MAARSTAATASSVRINPYINPSSCNLVINTSPLEGAARDSPNDYPALRAPGGGFASFSSSLGIIKAYFASALAPSSNLKEGEFKLPLSEAKLPHFFIC